MADIAALREELKKLAKIQASEGIADPDVDSQILSALVQHNRLYTVATLPKAEEELVLTLAWVKICLIRASTSVNDPNLSGGNIQQERESPFRKNMAMAERLRTRYKELSSSLKLIEGSGAIVVSQLYRKDDLVEAVVPLSISPLPPRIVLTSVADGAEVVVSWETETYSNFQEAMLYHLTGSSPLYVEWNYNSATGIPRLRDSSIKLLTFNDQTIRSAKTSGLDRTKTNRFVLVSRSLSGQFGYSNELVVNPF